MTLAGLLHNFGQLLHNKPLCKYVFENVFKCARNNQFDISHFKIYQIFTKYIPRYNISTIVAQCCTMFICVNIILKMCAFTSNPFWTMNWICNTSNMAFVCQVMILAQLLHNIAQLLLNKCLCKYIFENVWIYFKSTLTINLIHHTSKLILYLPSYDTRTTNAQYCTISCTICKCAHITLKMCAFILNLL